MITIKVPATSANMGSGFDSAGIALQYYNTTKVRECEGGLKISIVDESNKFLPVDERNLIYRAMVMVFDEVGYKLCGIEIIQENKIPITRGLGSSSASIVSGLLAANKISGNKIDKSGLVTMAAALEGHPDNTTASIVGGMTIAVKDNNKIIYTKIPVNCNEIVFGVFIPNFILRTRMSRGILPHTVPHQDCVYNSSRAALLAVSMVNRQYDNLRVALKDKLHQPYRTGLIKGCESIFKKADEYGCLGSYISGAGPAIVSVIKTQYSAEFKKNIDVYLKKYMPDWNMMILRPDNLGARII